MCFVSVSIHDFTPYYESELRDIRNLLSHLNITPLTLMIVPNWHDSENFNKLGKIYKIFENNFEVVLHGWNHWTSGYGNEFSLSPSNFWETMIIAGKKVLESKLGVSPHGFVAPKWVIPHDLLNLLSQHFEWTTSYQGMYSFRNNTINFFKIPVINFLYGKNKINLIAAGANNLLGRVYLHRKFPIRLALHPMHFSERYSIVRDFLQCLLEEHYQFLTSSELLTKLENKAQVKAIRK